MAGESGASVDLERLKCTADFCLIPIGGQDGSSVGRFIAECQRVLARTGLVYKVRLRETERLEVLKIGVADWISVRSELTINLSKNRTKSPTTTFHLHCTAPHGTIKMHGYGTGIEGDWDEVMKAIKECHQAVHKMGCPRVATDIRIGTRIDKPSSLSLKVESVENHLSSSN